MCKNYSYLVRKRALINAANVLDICFFFFIDLSRPDVILVGDPQAQKLKE